MATRRVIRASRFPGDLPDGDYIELRSHRATHAGLNERADDGVLVLAAGVHAGGAGVSRGTRSRPADARRALDYSALDGREFDPRLGWRRVTRFTRLRKGRYFVPSQSGRSAPQRSVWHCRDAFQAGTEAAFGRR